jgi:hypothetical protein
LGAEDNGLTKSYWKCHYLVKFKSEKFKRFCCGKHRTLWSRT